MRTRTALVVLVVLALASSVRADPREWVREIEGPRLTSENALLLVRAVDYWTGEPIEGARADLFWEVAHPTPGFGKAIVSGYSGADGWVRVPAGDLKPGVGHWVYVTAPGYAPNAEFEDFWDTVLEMREPLDLEMELVDPLERPVADLGVSLLLGCGHAPDVRMTRTDWRGRATLRDVNPDCIGQIWLWGSGILSEYGPYETPGPKEPTLRHRCNWSPDVVGRVLRHDGTPAQGVSVGVSNYHRGPWARTDPQGRFRLTGAGLVPWWDSVCVDPEDGIVGEPDAGRQQIRVAVPPPDVDLVVTLPTPGEEYVQEEETASIVARLQVRGGEPLRSAVEPTVFAVRDGDGLTCPGEYDSETGRWTVPCPPGDYAVIAWLSGPSNLWPGYSTARGRASAAAGKPSTIDLGIDPPRALRLDVCGLSEHDRLAVVAEQFEETVDPDQLEDVEDGILEVYAPASGPVFLRVEDARGDECGCGPIARVHVITVANLGPGATPFGVPTIGTCTVRARFVDEQGRPVEADASFRRGSPDEGADRDEAPGTLELELPLLPYGTLWVSPADEDRVGCRIRLPRPLPPGELDLGDVLLPVCGAPRLRVVDLEGNPTDARLRIVRGVHRYEVETDDEDHVGVVPEPWGPEPAIGEGARVLADLGSQDDNVMPWRTTLRGPGPWTIAPPKAGLDIRVRDADGMPVVEGLQVEVDGTEMAAGEADPLRVRALAAGPHDVVIGGEGLRGQHHRVVLGAEETRVLDVRLRPSR